MNAGALIVGVTGIVAIAAAFFGWSALRHHAGKSETPLPAPPQQHDALTDRR